MPDYMMISADDHIDLNFLPRDLWNKRLPRRLQERGPRIEQAGDEEVWVCDGQQWAQWLPGRWFDNPNRRSPAWALLRDESSRTRNWTLRPTTPELRLEDMDRDNVEVSVMYPPIFGMRTADRELAREIIRAYNDWALEFASAAPKRFIPIAQLYPDDAEASTNELLRVAKLGIKEVNFLVGTVTLAMYQEEWEPFWSAAEATDTIVTYHVGGVGAMGENRPSLGVANGQAFGIGLGEGGSAFLEPFTNLFRFGTLERHPKLRFVLGESDTGWVPYVVQQMDYRFEQARERARPGEFPLSRLPSELFREQVWATYQSDEVGLHLLQFFGDGHMMWASDYPHPDSTWPNSVDVVEKETAHLTPIEKKKLVRDNALAFFGLE